MSLDFQPYLESVCATYAQWWKLYTLTDAAGKRAAEAAPTFDFGLMVQAIAPQKPGMERGDSSDRPEKIERFGVLEGLRKYADRHVLLVGRPGSGKSTALARLMLEEATTQTSEVSSRGRIPILVELRYWQGSIVQLILNALMRHGLPLTSEQLEAVLARSLILFDGVNELPSEEARSQLMAFRRDHPKVPMIFTTRDLGLGGDLGIEQKLEMQPLTEAQMQAFVRAYVPEQAEALLRQLKDRLRELGQTPLLLWMLCGLFQQTGTIPENLGLVFRLFTQGYEQWLKQDVVIESDRAWWQPVLQQLAWVMMQGEQPTELRVAISKQEAVGAIAQFLKDKVPYAEDFARKCLRDLQKHHLIQAGTNPEELEFRHQLLQEYYAAEALLEQLPGLSDAALQREYLNYLKWTEPVALMLALVEREAQAMRVLEQALAVDWMLGARLAGEVKRKFQANTVDLIQQHHTALQLSFWLLVELFAQSRSEAAIPGLLKALEDADEDVRRNAAAALGKIGNAAAIPGLLKALEDADEDVRRNAAAALGKIGNAAAIPGLLKALEDADEYVRESAAAALGNIGFETSIPGLLKAMEDAAEDARGRAMDELGNIGFETSIPHLLKAMEDADGDALGRAAEALGKIGSEVAIPDLLKALEHSDEEVRGRAASALGKIGSEVAIPGLLKAMQDVDWEVCRRAASALGKIGSAAAIPGLLKVMEDANNYVSRRAAKYVSGRAAYALGKIGSAAAIPGLLKAMEDADRHARRSAADALGEIGSEAAIPGLLKAMEDADAYVRGSAAEALGKIGSEAAIPDLLKALEHSDEDVRWCAAYALGKISSAAAIPGLLKAMEDADSKVRRIAAEALGQLKDDRAAHILPHLLTLIPNDAGEDAHRVILAIQANCKYYNYSIKNEKFKIQNGKNIGSQTHTANPSPESDSALPIPNPRSSLSLFFSYAHKDEALRDQLNTHLALLKKQGIIDTWHDRDITAGTDWAQAIDTNLNRADIILLLISANFLASDYCYDQELSRALDRHAQGSARVIPILLRPCDWETAPFGKLQALPIAHGAGAKPVTQWGDPDEAFAAIAKGIRQVAADIRSQPSDPAHGQPAPSQPCPQDTLAKIEQTAKTMSGQPSISITGGIFNAPVNLLSPNQGYQPTTITDTPNSYNLSQNTCPIVTGIHMSLGGQHQGWGGTDIITVNLQNEGFCLVQVIRCSVYWKTVDGSTRYELKPNTQIRWTQTTPSQDGSGNFVLPKMLKPGYIIQLSFSLTPQDILASGIDALKYVELPGNEWMASSLVYEAFAEVTTESNHVMSGSISFFYPRDKDERLNVLLK